MDIGPVNSSPPNTNPVVYEQTAPLEQFEQVSEITRTTDFITRTWRPFINTLATEVRNLFASLKGLATLWQPGDVKFSLRKRYDEMPGFIHCDGGTLPAATFPALNKAIGGDDQGPDASVFSLPKTAGRMVRIDGRTEPTLGINPDGYQIELPLTDRFSTDEQITNKVWIDGKRIYRKVIKCGALPNNTTKLIAHGIHGVGTYVAIYGTTFKPSTGIALPLPNVDNAGDWVRLAVNTTNVVLITYANLTAWTHSYVVVEYTKDQEAAIARGPEALRLTAWLKT